MLRKDNWTKENDTLLAEIVIHNIKCGNTQLAGFEEAAEKLSRTAPACGFRWNKELRHQYEAEIIQAKMERKHEEKQEKVKTKGHTLDEIIGRIEDYIQQVKEASQETSNITQQAEIDYLRHVVTERDQTITTLQEQLQEANEAVLTLKDDYAAMLRVLGHARQMGIVDGDIAKIG